MICPTYKTDFQRLWMMIKLKEQKDFYKIKGHIYNLKVNNYK
jgi:hypothetical protein